MSSYTTDPHDVVVVGARPAGAATALQLAQAGLRVLVVDRARRGSDTLSTHALMRPAVTALARLGVLGTLRAGGTPPITGVDFRYDDALETVPLRAPVDPLVAPRRHHLDRVLADAAADAGAEVRFGVAVTDLARDHRGRVTGVLGRAPDGAPWRADARLVVGADGRSSLVARRAGAAVVHRGVAAGGTVYGHVADPDGDLPGDRYTWAYRAHAWDAAGGSAGGVIPTDGGRACVWAGAAAPVVRAALRTGTSRAFARLLRAAAPDLADVVGRSDVDRPLRAFPGVPALVRRPYGPGWALVGDAGAFRDPITAHGISDALRDAALLAGTVAPVGAGADSHALDEALADYAATRDALMTPVLDATEPIAAFTWDLPALRDHLLALSAAMKIETRALSALAPLPLAA